MWEDDGGRRHGRLHFARYVEGGEEEEDEERRERKEESCVAAAAAVVGIKTSVCRGERDFYYTFIRRIAAFDQRRIDRWLIRFHRRGMIQWNEVIKRSFNIRLAIVVMLFRTARKMKMMTNDVVRLPFTSSMICCWLFEHVDCSSIDSLIDWSDREKHHSLRSNRFERFFFFRDNRTVLPCDGEINVGCSSK